MPCSPGKGRGRGSVPEIDPGVSILAECRRSLLWRTQCDCSCSPHLNPKPQIFELHVVERELISTKTWKAIQHLGENNRIEAAVLLSCEFEEARKAKARLDGHEIDVVARLSSAEYREHLVGSELLGRQEVETRTRLGWEQAGIARQVDLGSFELVRDDEACEPRASDQPINL
jgi:hypothetical protein